MAHEAMEKRIGDRLRKARDSRGMTAQSLAKALGVSYQQLRKYETGQNRISVSMLFRLSQVLDVDIMQFFMGLGCGEPRRGSMAPASANFDLGSALSRVDDIAVRKRLMELIEALDKNVR